MSRSLKLIPEKILQVVVLVLENHQGEILLSQRHKNKHLAGYWEFPGGKLENNESLTQALARECLEELDYAIVNPRKILNIPFSYSEMSVHLHVFFERNNQPKIRPAEQQNLQWINIHALANMQLPPANLAIIEYLLNK